MLQVLVYAGAIMVLFIFVVMILNREEVAPLALRGRCACWAWRPRVYLLAVFANVVGVGAPTLDAPPVVPETFGTVASIGDLLFREFLYPFEAISLLLLVAIVGGVVVSRSHQKEVAAERAADYRKTGRASWPTRDYPADASRRAAGRRRRGTTEPCRPPTT